MVRTRNRNNSCRGEFAVTTDLTQSGAPVPPFDEWPELLGRAVDHLRQAQETLAGLTKALPAGPGGSGGNAGTAARRRAGGPALTQGEHRVLTLVAAGLSNREIAQAMGISDKTAKNYVHALLLKLGVTSRTKAAFTALSEGLVDPRECGRARREAPRGAGPVPRRRCESGEAPVRLLPRTSSTLDASVSLLKAGKPHEGGRR
jgi:DNA-binding CsgD family transcriptional regulator